MTKSAPSRSYVIGKCTKFCWFLEIFKENKKQKCNFNFIFFWSYLTFSLLVFLVFKISFTYFQYVQGFVSITTKKHTMNANTRCKKKYHNNSIIKKNSKQRSRQIIFGFFVFFMLYLVILYWMHCFLPIL